SQFGCQVSNKRFFDNLRRIARGNKEDLHAAGSQLIPPHFRPVISGELPRGTDVQQSPLVHLGHISAGGTSIMFREFRRTTKLEKSCFQRTNPLSRVDRKEMRK